MWAAGRISSEEAIGYVVAQLIGGIVGAFVLWLILKGKIAGYDVAGTGLGQKGWGAEYLGSFGPGAAALTEFGATFLFTLVILGATSEKSTTPLAGLSNWRRRPVLPFPFL